MARNLSRNNFFAVCVTCCNKEIDYQFCKTNSHNLQHRVFAWQVARGAILRPTSLYKFQHNVARQWNPKQLKLLLTFSNFIKTNIFIKLDMQRKGIWVVLLLGQISARNSIIGKRPQNTNNNTVQYRTIQYNSFMNETL